MFTVIVAVAVVLTAAVALALWGLCALTRVLSGDDDSTDVGLEILDYVPYVATLVTSDDATRDASR